MNQAWPDVAQLTATTSQIWFSPNIISLKFVQFVFKSDNFFYFLGVCMSFLSAPAIFIYLLFMLV